MAYRKIKSYSFTEAELRLIWKQEYCDVDVFTFDKIHVKFYEDMFDHAFFESENRKPGDKSILSLNRLEKIYWIKDTLQDSSAILKMGWDNNRKTYYKNRRVAVVKNNYVVVIFLTGLLKAKFITAYEKDDITNVLASPDFIKDTKYFGDE